MNTTFGSELNHPTPILAPVGAIRRLDSRLNSLIPTDAHIERLAGGFQFTEGPLWFSTGHLWFSDVIGNVVRQWSTEGVVTELLQNAGGHSNAPPGSFIGPNGMIADADGAVLLCQHTNRRIVRISRNRQISTVIDNYEGKRLNSPNDLVYRSDGSLYFTDPPYGLLQQDNDSSKDLSFNGVYRLFDGKLQVIIKDLTRPNGLAFSPDEQTLYVANSEPQKLWMRYDVQPDGTVSNGRVFFDVTSSAEKGLPDGMKLDARGNLYCAGPGGVWVFSPDGSHLGTIVTPETPANCNWGDDGKVLYITAETSLYRIRLAVEGRKALY